MASRRRRERLLLCGGRVRVYVYMYVYVYGSQSPSVGQWKSLAPSSQSGRGARGEEPVASASGRVRSEERVKTQPCLLCCPCIPCLLAKRVEFILRTSQTPAYIPHIESQ